MGWWEDIFRPINFGKPDEKKRQEIMKRGYGFSDRDQIGDLGRRSQYQKPSTSTRKMATSKPFKWPAGELSTQRTQNKPYVPDDQYLAAKARNNPQLNPPQSSLDMTPGGINAIPQGPPMGPSLMEQILDRLDDPYGGFKGTVDTSALDAALQSQLGQIGKVRANTNQNFTTSDRNLYAMHDAAKQEALTKGKAAFQDIGADQVAALRDTRQDAVGDLQAIKNEQNAKRVAMLKSLGIEQAGAVPTDSSELDQAIGSITSRGAAEEANASEDQGSNLAYNQTFANSVGQQGAQRRAELAQQLQGILGQLGQAEVEANQQYGLTKAQLTEQAKERDYNMWQQQRQFDAQQYNNLFNQKMQLDDQNFRREQTEYDRMLEQQKMQMQAPPEVPGFGGLAEDLLNNYSEPESQQAMSVLSEVLSSDYMNGIPEGYDRASILARRLRERGVNPVIASQLATNYSNLGNNNGFAPLPY
jgi:hypothetical protein